jgi:hypothetical protein
MSRAGSRKLHITTRYTAFGAKPGVSFSGARGGDVGKTDNLIKSKGV